MSDIFQLLYWHPVALLLGGLADLLLGDPLWLPHPVRLLGKVAASLEKQMRLLPISERLQGICYTICVLAMAALPVFISLILAARLHPWALILIQALWLHWGLAVGDLRAALRRITSPLAAGDLAHAREMTGHIVSRDTASLDEQGICRSGIESGAENAVDAIVAPWFRAMVGGPIGLWLFKAASTLDSMVGYKIPRYLHFGWASARLDDLLNWLPARLAILPFSAAGLLLGFRAGSLKRAWRITRRDHGLHASPNSGIGEAWMAGFLGVRLMGPNRYHGELKEKPWLGGEFPDPLLTHLRLAALWVWRLGLVCWTFALGFRLACIHFA